VRLETEDDESEATLDSASTATGQHPAGAHVQASS
jgi:hypothetical protein